MGKRSGKGGEFERKLAKELSLWWTNNKRDDVFWRTSNSGGRGKVRSKRGARTFGQHGDLQAVDPVGQPLLDLMTLELKKGYNNRSVFDCLDRPERYLPNSNEFKRLPQQWTKFKDQARGDAKLAGSHYWALIWRRDSRAITIHVPYGLVKLHWPQLEKAGPHVIWCSDKGLRYFVMRLDDFLAEITPDDVKALLKKLSRKRKRKAPARKPKPVKLAAKIKKRPKIRIKRKA